MTVTLALSIEVPLWAPSGLTKEKAEAIQQKLESQQVDDECVNFLSDVSSQFANSPEYIRAYESLHMAAKYHATEYRYSDILFTPMLGVVPGEKVDYGS